MNPRHRKLPLLALLCLLLAGQAAASSGTYIIEMVIFEQPSGHAETLTGKRPQAGATVGSLRRASPGVEPLPVREGQLGPVAYTLQRKGARVLAHLRWRHRFGEGGSEGWYRVSGDELQGAVRFKLGRFIHIYTDLRVAGEEQPIREHGRIRSGQLHYIDHPRLGILVRADRVEKPKAATPAPETPQQDEDHPLPRPKDDNPPEQRAPAGEIPRALPDPT